MAGFREVNDASFDEVVTLADGVVAVDFTASWCPPCRILAPVLEAVAAENGLTVVALDADTNPRTMARFGVRGLPTVIFFRGGEEVDRVVGAVPKSVLEAKVRAA